MSLIRLQNVSLRYDSRVVLRNVYFRLQAGERVGLVGKNGTGKTTVLQLLLGRLEPSEGTVERSPELNIGYFSQFSELDGAVSIQQILEDLFADVRAWEHELAQLAQAREQPGDAAELTPRLERQAHLIDAMNHREGWDYPRHIDTVLTRLGFSQERRMQPVAELSGGWRNRA